MTRAILRLLPLLLAIGCAPRMDLTPPPVATQSAPTNPTAANALTTPEAHPLTTATTDKIKPSTAKSITNWQINGLIGVRSPKKSWTANIVWVQHGQDDYQLRLFGAMGGGTSIIERHDGIISYKDEHKHIHATQARLLVKEQTGLDLPVESLYYWVRAIPAPIGAARIAYNAENQPSVMTQGGYTVQYLQYQQVKGRALPTKMTMQGKGIFIKLIIKDWQIH